MRIIWALDPFVEDKSLQRSAVRALQVLTETQLADIEPIHVYGPSVLEVPDPRFPFSPEQVEESALEGLQEILEEIRIPGLRPLRVLRSPDQALRHEADQLVEYARGENVDLIVVSTKARRGLDRWVMGSFAETLLQRSDVPVMVVNPTWDKTADLQEILFPTDFSDESRFALQEVGKFARQAGSRITLYHRLQLPVVPNLDILVSSLLTASTYFQEELSLKEVEIAEWADELRDLGVRVESMIDADMTEGVAEGILGTALDRNVSMIAMAAHSGGLRGWLGATTRKVLRATNTLVWVVYPSVRGKVQAHHTLRQKGERYPPPDLPYQT